MLPPTNWFPQRRRQRERERETKKIESFWGEEKLYLHNVGRDSAAVLAGAAIYNWVKSNIQVCMLCAPSRALYFDAHQHSIAVLCSTYSNEGEETRFFISPIGKAITGVILHVKQAGEKHSARKWVQKSSSVWALIHCSSKHATYWKRTATWTWMWPY